MKKLWLIVPLALALLAPPVAAADKGCLACHQGFASPMPPQGGDQAPACVFCHGGDGQARDAAQAHRGLRANPSALEHADQTCGRCHPGRPATVRRSPMATNMGIINQTRFLWGAQPKPEPALAVRDEGPLKALPEIAPDSPAVDDLLRRRCLRCHLWSPGADMDGARRAAGCAACHAPTDDGGRKPLGHRLTRRVPTSQCLRCHAECGAGAAFVGLSAADETSAARFDQTAPGRPGPWQGRFWRKTRPDLHFQAGMACIDCHPSAEIMGDGQIRAAGILHVGVRCQTCHGEPGQPPALARTSHGQAMTNLTIGHGQALVRGKIDDALRRAPSLATGPTAPVAHLAPGHQRIACHACHDAVNPAVWGLQVLLETRPGGLERWRDIAAQGDHQLLALTQNAPADAAPVSVDLLSGQSRPGVWVASPFFRRERWRVHGQGPDGRTFLLAPRFQYVVTLLDQGGRPKLASQIPKPGLGLTIWRPHATRRATVGCADCHGNAMALGLGLTFVQNPGEDGPLKLAPELWLPRAEGLDLDHGWTTISDLDGRPRQAFLVPGSRPYERQTLRALLSPGKAYIRWLLREMDRRPASPASGP